MSVEVKPIRSGRDHEAALKEVDRLWGAKTGTRDGDRLDVLATLIDVHEAEHYPMDPPDPIEAIKFRMEQQGLTRRDLEDIIGTRTRIAEILNRKRGLSIGMIRRATLARPESYVRGVLENMYECKREHGNAAARIGITGGGVAPNYKIEFEHKEPSLGFSGFKVGIVGVFAGRSHKKHRASRCPGTLAHPKITENQRVKTSVTRY
jgi:HTH-type transcriptional regulator / antitoxin HigA